MQEFCHGNHWLQFLRDPFSHEENQEFVENHLKCFPALFHPVFNTLVSFCIRDLFQHLHKLLLPKAPKNKLK